MHFFTKGHAALQIAALQILTDILTQHGAHLLDSNPALLKVYLKALKSSSKAPEVQAAATVAVCKLTLGRVIHDSEASNDLLRTLVVAYFDPSTQGNQGVRQTLSYFLPVYSYSRRENQDRMRSVAMDAMHSLFNIHESLDGEDEDSEMVSLNTIGAHLVDWTDPRKCYAAGDSMGLGDEVAKKTVNGDVHLDLARDILERLNSNATSKYYQRIFFSPLALMHTSEEEKKILAPLLGKIHVSPASTEGKIRALYSEVSTAVDQKIIADATGRNAIYKIHVSLGKIVNSLGEKQGRKSIMPEGRQIISPEGKTILDVEDDDNEKKEILTTKRQKQDRIEEEKEEVDLEEDDDDDDDDGTIIGEGETITSPRKRDSLMEELLSDEESDEF
jgi:condensin complex subunit 3